MPSSLTPYRACSAAVRQLIEDPSRRPVTTGPDGIFTELDVIFRAAGIANVHSMDPEDQDYWNKMFVNAANNVLGHFYRQGNVVRFGPVQVPGFQRADYLRFDLRSSKIVYAGPAGPETLHTPNGDFRRMFVHEDEIGEAGRKKGAIRDDFISWADQDLFHGAEALPRDPKDREIARLRAELRATEKVLADTQRALFRLREHAARMTKADLREEIARLAQHAGNGAQ